MLLLPLELLSSAAGLAVASPSGRAEAVTTLPHLVLHLVNVLFNFLIFDTFLFDFIRQFGDGKA